VVSGDIGDHGRYVKETGSHIGTKNRKVRWAVPRWAYAPRLWRDLKRILNLRSLARVIFASAIVCVAIVLVCKIALPNLAVQNLWPMLFALPGILLAVVAQIAILTLISPFVTIRSDRLQYVHGQNGFEIKSKSIAWIQVSIFSDSIKRIKIAYTQQGKLRILKIGIASHISLEELFGLFPLEPKVLDARGRWSAKKKAMT